jgi:hypothetical protein
MKFVRESSPLIEEITSSPTGMQTISKIWEDLMNYIKVLSAFKTKAETTKIGF